MAECSMKINLIELNDIKDLKSYGNFKYVKALISSEFGFAIKVNSWEKLYEKIHKIKKTTTKNEKQLCFLIKDERTIKQLGNFSTAKTKLSEFVGIEIHARSWVGIFDVFKKVVFALLPNEVINKKLSLTYEEKVKKFEEVKFQNFVNSSKLEGINIVKGNLSMEELIQKYTAIGEKLNG